MAEAEAFQVTLHYNTIRCWKHFQRLDEIYSAVASLKHLNFQQTFHRMPSRNDFNYVHQARLESNLTFLSLPQRE